MNKDPTDPDYLKTVQAGIGTFLVRNPGVNKADIPTELVTASWSSLDSDLLPTGVKICDRSVERLNQRIDEHTEGLLLGLFGRSMVNGLKLNVTLNERE